MAAMAGCFVQSWWQGLRTIPFKESLREMCTADYLMREMKQTLSNRQAESKATAEFQGRRWVTRRGIKVDRTACCWLVLRFIDCRIRHPRRRSLLV